MAERYYAQNKAAQVIIRPHITEKTTERAEHRAYTFIVDDKATKPEIKKAVMELYKVEPVKVRTVNVAAKATFHRGFAGTKRGFKKAIVYLKEGDSIDLV